MIYIVKCSACEEPIKCYWNGKVYAAVHLCPSDGQTDIIEITMEEVKEKEEV